MKKLKILLASFLLLFNSIYGQSVNNLNGYKYVYVAPLIYEDGSNDKFGVRSGFIKMFESSEILLTTLKSF